MLSRLEQLYLGEWGWLAAGRAARLIGFLLALLLAAFLSWKAVNNQITETQVLTESRVSLARYLDGTAYRPFAYRALTPALVNLADHVIGVPALLRHAPTVLQEKMAGFCSRATAQPQVSCDGVASYFVVAWGACLCFLLLIYANVQLLFRNPLISFLSVGFAFLVVNAILLARLSHIYDFSVLCGVSLLLLCLQRRWTLLFTLLLPVAFATKETLVLYAGVGLVVNFGHMPVRRSVGLFLLQMASFRGRARGHPLALFRQRGVRPRILPAAADQLFHRAHQPRRADADAAGGRAGVLWFPRQERGAAPRLDRDPAVVRAVHDRRRPA